MNKKNSFIIILTILVIIIVGLLIWSKQKEESKQLEQQKETEINQVLNNDSTKSIQDNLNKIEMNSTIDTDITSVDTELEKI